MSSFLVLPESSLFYRMSLFFIAQPSVSRRVVALLVVFGLLTVMGCDSGGGEPADPPPIPIGLSAVQKGNAVELDWQSSRNAESYNVYRAPGDTDVDSSADRVNGDTPITDTAFTDDSVQAGTVYSYGVTAVGADGRESSASASITLRVFAEPPTRP